MIEKMELPAADVMKHRVVNIQDINKRYNEWAKKQFPNSTPISSLIGLKREVDETIKEINDLDGLIKRNENHEIYLNGAFGQYFDSARIEYADCLMYLIDSARRFGLSLDDLFLALDEKLQINLKRNWKINEDKSYSHV